MTYQNMLVDILCEPETFLGQVVHRTRSEEREKEDRQFVQRQSHFRCALLHRLAATCQCQTLHVATLRTSQCQNTVLSQNIERHWVNAFLVDDNERLVLVGTRANFSFQLHDLLDTIVDEFTFGCHETIALFGILVEETGIDLPR